MPKALYLLVTPIEFLSTFLIRPFSLAVRLFANMLAGHILLVTFSVLCITLWSASSLAGVLVLSLPDAGGPHGFESWSPSCRPTSSPSSPPSTSAAPLHPDH